MRSHVNSTFVKYASVRALFAANVVAKSMNGIATTSVGAASIANTRQL